VARPRVHAVPHCGPRDVLLWQVDIGFDLALDDAAFAVLSAPEHHHARRFHRSQDALRFATVRAALRSQLASHTGVDAERIAIEPDAFGRPALAAPGALDFNVSHAGSHGLIALSSCRRVGVDIELCRPGFDWRQIAATVLSRHEASCLEQLAAESQTAAFYNCWTAKEALLKALGVGIASAAGLDSFSVLPRRGDAVTFAGPARQELSAFQAAWISSPMQYAACVAWSMNEQTQID
jgi:4'-phosphopantetheinyl transferase